MPESLTENEPLDGHTIDFRDAGELKRWAMKLDCSLMELIAAVYAVGSSASAVREHLKKQG